MRERFTKRLIVTAAVVALAGLMFALKRPPLGIDLAGGAEMLYRLDDTELKRELEDYQRYLAELDEPAVVKKKKAELDRGLAQLDEENDPVRKAGIRASISSLKLQLNRAALDKRINGIEENIRGGETTQQAADIIRKRINPAGQREVVVTQMGSSRIRVQIPFRKDLGGTLEEAQKAFDKIVADVKNIIERTGILEFHLALYARDYREEYDSAKRLLGERKPPPAGLLYALPPDEFQKLADKCAENNTSIPHGYVELKKELAASLVKTRAEGDIVGVVGLLLREDHMGLTGSIIANAYPDFGRRGPEVKMDLTGAGSVLFERVTDQHKPVGKPPYTKHGDKPGWRLGIVLDGVVQSAPVIQARISGTAVIEGDFTEGEARALALVLKSGRLPMKVKFESSYVVGPSLGRDSIQRGLRSILIGGVLVVVFMVLYYRVAGLVSVLALVLNLVLIFGGMSLTEATLTLPGIAGILLTIGMAVDASVLIFERIREERDRGRPLDKAVEAGFDRALVTIIDANLTTLIAAAVLYKFGTGPIKGFAVTLFMGIVASLFTSLYVSRFIIEGLVQSGTAKELSMMQVVKAPSISFMKARYIAFVLSLAAVIAGLTGFRMYEDKYGVDFAGGTLFQVRFAEGGKVAISTLRQAVEEAAAAIAEQEGLEGPGVTRVQSFEKDIISGGGGGGPTRFTVTTQRLKGPQVDRLKSMLAERFADSLSDAPFPLTSSIGPNVAEELGWAALYSIGAALLLIFFYIVLRFDFSAAFGAGAVAALFHDVSIAVGAIVLVDWSGLMEVKIDLPIVAALLTIVGYSLNDTIVVYDRIRENRRNYPSMPLAQVVDASINQTLSRTLLTSVTTLIAVLALFLFGGGVIHGFSFALLIGVVVGTYSSIFIASPLVVAFSARGAGEERKEAAESDKGKEKKKKKKRR